MVKLTLHLAITALISQTHALALKLEPRDSTCPSSYKQCGSSKLPDNFCCSSSSTCISLDDSSSAICCPEGQNCAYIAPITCDVQLQNATIHPKNPVKTTRLDEELPKCGSSCCPFGYTCQGDSTCALNKEESATATSVISSATSTTKSRTWTTTDASKTEDKPPSTISAISSSDAASSANTDPDSNSTIISSSKTCPSFPGAAIAAGFFPGAIFGALSAFLVLFCLRRRKNRSLPPSVKVFNNTQRSSSGTLIGISEPIPSDDTSFRTDFLLQPTPRSSNGSRSMLQRTGTRVKSLFGSTPKSSNMRQSKPPPLPLPINPTPRQPSTESIKVYTPPGTFANTGFLRPDPCYTVERPGTTFTEMMDRVGFRDGKGDPCYRVGDGKSGLRGQRDA